jgi:hypothetical protein
MSDATLKSIRPSLPQLPVVHYLISTSEGKHVAHCLDLDLVCTDGDWHVAVRKLDDLVKAQIELSLQTGQLANLATKAPMSCWKQFYDGTHIELEPNTIHIRIPDAAQVVMLESPEGEVGRLLARAA